MALGVAQATVSGWENGKRPIRVDDLERVAKALGVEVSDFLVTSPSEESAAQVRQEIERQIRKEVHLGMKLLPVIGRVRAGLPLLSEENVEEWIPVPIEFAEHADFMLRVRGDSMEGAGILDDDYVMMRHATRAEVRPGSIVAAIRPGGEATLKILAYRQGKYYLDAANPKYPPIELNGDDVIQGKYVGLFTKREGMKVEPAGGQGSTLPSGEWLLDLAAQENGVDPEVLRRMIDLAKSMKKG